jgi:N-acetylglucosaminyl-diphospho-decaprenol L-rhamnosyltransferase
MSRVDVIVVSHNSAGELRACVEPLVDDEDIRVIVVDSASADDSLSRVSDLGVTSIPLTENRGFAHGCNAGAAAGSAPYVLLLNPDATLSPAALGRMVAVADGDPGVGAVAPRIVEPDGTLDWSQRRFPRLRSTFAQAFFLHRFFPLAAWTDELVRDATAYDSPGSPEWASGACLLIRRTAWERLHGLDEGFFLYCEDMDVCRRLRDEGLDVRYEPGAVCVHEGGASAPRAALLPVLAASRIRYARRHRSLPVALLERLGVVAGGLTHALVTRGGHAARHGNLRAVARALQPRPRPGLDEPAA